jgi:hypothetical protein
MPENKVLFKPEDKEATVNDGETIIQAANLQSAGENPPKKEKAEKGLEEFKKELATLKVVLSDSKAALPIHDASPKQWIAIEELEDKIAKKKRVLKTLKENQNK